MPEFIVNFYAGYRIINRDLDIVFLIIYEELTHPSLSLCRPSGLFMSGKRKQKNAE